MIQKFNEFFQFESQKMEDAKVELEHLASNHLLDLIDLGFETIVEPLNGAEDSLFIKVSKSGWFLRFGCKDQLLENCLFPLLEILKDKYPVTFYFTESNISSRLEDCDLDFVLSGEADFTMYEIYIRCKIL